MKERDFIINLYELYKDLLTSKQRFYFENYYFEDLSLGEISENNGVSRAIVSKTVNLVISKLKGFESSLNIYKKKLRLEEIIEEIMDKSLKEKLKELL